METNRRGSQVTLRTLQDLLESPLTTEEVHKRLTDDKDSISSHDANMDRESNSSPLSTLDELQEQLAVDGNSDDTVVTGQTEHSDPDGASKPPLSYIDEGLPDLLRSGSPLRRRVSSPVSATLKHVKREVALSRQRSLRLKAQVDRLEQQNESGPGWSENRHRVAEEVRSVVKLLLPLTDLEAAEVNQPSQANTLDTALLQLKKVARSLALNNNSQGKERSGEDAAILQQALWDRDEAIAKKQGMETELLRSKNEMMTLNNQLLEAVQSRLELSIELEAWKDDVQTILHHQLLKQQQEEAQKKPKGFAVLRRSNKPLPQKPDYSTLAHTPVLTPQSPAATQRWKDKFRRGKIATQGPVESQPQMSDKEDNFQTVSLD